MTGGRVTRSGAGLRWNGHPYRFTGLNVWRAAVATYNQPPSTGYNVNDGTTLADSLTAINSPTVSCNVIRCWFFQQFARNSAGNTAPSSTYNWAAFDKVLSVADAARVKVLACLQDNWSWSYTNTNAPQLAASWFLAGGYDSVHFNYEAVPYRQYVQDFIARYAGDDRILALELVNEADVSGGGTCPANAGTIAAAFAADVGGLIKSADPGMLVSFGIAGQVCGFNATDLVTVHNQSQVDLCSFHDYTGETNQGGTWGGGNGLDNCVTRMAGIRPVYVGECGMHLNSATISGSRAARSHYLRAKADMAFNKYGLAGYLPWHWDSRNYSDDYNYSLSDPALSVLGAYLHG